MDPNSDILLEVINVNRKSMATHCHLYYKFLKGGEETIQLIGHVNFDVKDLVNNWEKKVKRHFLKPERNRYDNKVIEEERKKDFYVEYIIKKYEKMELITKEGIMRPRLLDFADVIIEIEEKLRPLTKYPEILQRSTIANYVKMYCRKLKIPTSMFGEMDIDRS